MKITPGTTLGPFEMVKRIGAGGMGEVWKAWDKPLIRDRRKVRVFRSNGVTFDLLT